MTSGKKHTFLTSRWFLIVSGGILGAAGGFLYYYYYGCTTGCPINSSPYTSMIMGGLIGYLAGDMINDAVNKPKTQKSNPEKDIR